MDISKMTPQQRAELKAQLEAEERAEKQKREDDVNSYKELTAEFCHKTLDKMVALSSLMRQRKDEVFSDVESLIELKEKLFNAKVDRHSNSFTADGITVSLLAGGRTTAGMTRWRSASQRSRSSFPPWPRMMIRRNCSPL